MQRLTDRRRRAIAWRGAWDRRATFVLMAVVMTVLLTWGGLRLRSASSASRPSPVRDPGPFEDQEGAGVEDLWRELVEAQNRRIAESSPRLVFVGDSLTEFWLDEGRSFWDRNYAPLGALNLGIRGDRTENVLWRLKASPLSELNPEVVVIQVGVNNLSEDTPRETAEGILSVVDLVSRLLPESKLVYVALFPAGRNPGRHRELIRETNDIVIEALRERDIVILDFGERFLEPDGTISDEIMWDYLHLTQKGYAIWADAMEPALKALMNGTSNETAKSDAGTAGS